MATTKTAPRSSADTRAHVLAVVKELFYWRGIRATGVDTVAAEAGVAPTTLYRLFGSKDDLVGAYVEYADAEFRARLERAIAEGGADPRAQVLAMFDAVYAEVEAGKFRGCPSLMTLAEFPDADLPAHRNAVASKARACELLAGLTRQLDVEDPEELAEELMLVLEGLHASSQSLGAAGPARRARGLAEKLLATAR